MASNTSSGHMDPKKGCGCIVHTVSIIERNWMLPVKTTLTISVAFLLMKDTAFSYCFVCTGLGTFQLLPAVPVL